MTTSEGLDATSPVKEFILLYLMPEKCFEYFFTNLNFLHVPCLKIVLSKTVGLWIVLGTVLAQLPQLLRLTRRGSADGVSLGSALLHLYSILGPLVYCLARDFPLSAWSDKLFIAVQAASVCFLLLHYRGRTIQGMLLVLVYGAVVVLLGLYGTTLLATTLQSSSILALIASKAVQAGTNFSSGQTGELSRVSVLLVWAGSLALIFVSVQEKGTILALLAHILSACLSTVLLAQVLRCGQRISTRSKAKSKFSEHQCVPTLRSTTSSLMAEKEESWAAEPTLVLGTAAKDPLHSPMKPCSLQMAAMACTMPWATDRGRSVREDALRTSGVTSNTNVTQTYT